MAPRSKHATVAELVAVCLPFSQSAGPSFCRYGDEGKHVCKAQTIHDPITGLEGMRDLLISIREVQPNLALKTTTTTQALRDLATECKSDATSKWPKMTAAEFEDWVETLQRRIRNGCRAVAQALNKDKVWARRLFEDYGLDEEQADEDDDARDHDRQEDDPANIAQDAAPSTDILGFDEELLLPWRQRGAGAPKDLGLPLPCGGKPRDEPAVASWPDGFSARIPELT